MNEKEESDSFIDRPRGILTRQDRKYLADSLDKDLNSNAIAQRDYRIRQRIRHSILDFYLLADLPSDQIRQVFRPITESENPDADDPALASATRAVFRFLYHGLGPMDPEEDAYFRWLLSEGVRTAIVHTYAVQGLYVDPAVVFDVFLSDAVSLPDIKKKYDDGNYLIQEELEALWIGGEITAEQFLQRLYDQPDPTFTNEENEVATAERGRQQFTQDPWANVTPLLTDVERTAFTSEEVGEKAEREAAENIRRKIDQLNDDLAFLREHREDLYKKTLETVCEAWDE